MKQFIKSLAGLLLIAGLVNPLYTSAASPVAKPKQAVRYLELAESSDGGGKSCKIPADRTIRINLNKDDEDIYNCVNDEMDYYKLDNVRSATIILLGNDSCGDTSNSWQFQLRTIIEPVSTPWLSLKDLKGRVVGDIVSRGIRLEKAYNGSEQITDQLTCVSITVSAPG